MKLKSSVWSIAFGSVLHDDTWISLGSETEIFCLGLVATEILCVFCFGQSFIWQFFFFFFERGFHNSKWLSKKWGIWDEIYLPFKKVYVCLLASERLLWWLNCKLDGMKIPCLFLVIPSSYQWWTSVRNGGFTEPGVRVAQEGLDLSFYSAQLRE